MTSDDSGAVPVHLPRSATLTMAGPDGAPFQVFVAWPAEPPPPAGHPAIYLLDANALFGTVVETVRLRCRRPDVTGVVPVIVVGIGFPTEQPYDRARRTFAYTPGPPAGVADGEGRPEGDTGGAEAFRGWIEAVLKPEIERRFAVDRARQTLLGHSLAGYFALHTLVTAPGSFTRYVAASPSVWWDEARLHDGLPRLGRWMAEASSELRVMVTVGAYEQSLAPGEAGGPRAAQTAERRASRRMIDGARGLAGRIAALSGNDVRTTPVTDRPSADSVRTVDVPPAHPSRRARVAFEVFAEADHASAVLRTVDRCLRFVLAP